MWQLASTFGFVGGHPPCHGGFAPLDPPLPTLVGLGFVGILGPTRGLVANVGNSPPCFILGAHPPQPLPGGFAPLDPPFAHPRGLWVCWRFGPHSWRGLREWPLAPFWFCGGTPPRLTSVGF